MLLAVLKSKLIRAGPQGKAFSPQKRTNGLAIVRGSITAHRIPLEYKAHKISVTGAMTRMSAFRFLEDITLITCNMFLDKERLNQTAQPSQ